MDNQFKRESFSVSPTTAYCWSSRGVTSSCFGCLGAIAALVTKYTLIVEKKE